jgi:hypothetical protein
MGKLSAHSQPGLRVAIGSLSVWVVLIICWVFPALVGAGIYQAPVEYREDLVRILDRDDVAWDAPNAHRHDFASVQVSADGSTVLFNVTCEFCASGTGPANRPFLVDPDGAGLTDISDIYPSDIVSSWWSWGNLRINDDASDVFVRIQRDIGYYGQHHWYAYDVTSGQRRDAVSNPFRNVGATINASGSRLYFAPYDAGFDDALQRRRMGFFFADQGGDDQQFLDVVQLPCATADCAAGSSAVNYASLLGSSAENDRVFLAWSNSRGAENSWEVYRAGLDGGLVPLTGVDRFWVDRDLNPRGYCSADGELALYKYRHRRGDPLELSVVDLSSGAQLPITWTTDVGGFSSFITRSGRYVLVSGESGDANALHYRTLFDLQQGVQRDTDSYHLPRGIRAVSNITSDDSTYYLTYADALYRVDLMPPHGTSAPRVISIDFDAPALLDADGVRIGIAVAIADNAGATGIDWVRLVPVVEGREDPEFGMGRAPLQYFGAPGSGGGDLGFQRLYDDGTNGDAVAGDGVFSFYGIATRKDSRKALWNSWYLHHTLPDYVGIRIVAKDVDGNYSITDSRLLVTNVPLDLERHTAQQAYIAYYGRPADPAGLDYWAARLDRAGGDLRQIIAAFGTSAEYDSRFRGLSSVALISNLYNYLFNRDPEPAGLAYWRQQYESGAKTLQAIALDVLYGAQNEDLLTVGNKLIASDHFSELVRAGCRYTAVDIDAVAGLLAGVDHTPGSITDVERAMDQHCGR